MHRQILQNPPKPFASYKEQIEKLRSRGCVIDDDDFAKKKLQEINYYRITAYFLPFKNADETYQNIAFKRIVNIYEFDTQCRQWFFNITSDIEIFFRSVIAYFHSSKFGPYGYLDKKNYSNKHNHHRFIKRMKEEICNRKKDPCIRHHIEKYASMFPIWVLVEVFTFGTLSLFFSDLKNSEKVAFSKQNMNSLDYKIIENDLRCMAFMRNVCAHHARLYYRSFPFAPKEIGLTTKNKSKFYAMVLMAKRLYPDKTKWNIQVEKLIEIVKEYNDDICLEHMGFPRNWEKDIKWN